MSGSLFNINSPTQLRVLLYTTLQLGARIKVPRTPHGHYSTSEAAVSSSGVVVVVGVVMVVAVVVVVRILVVLGVVFGSSGGWWMFLPSIMRQISHFLGVISV